MEAENLPLNGLIRSAWFHCPDQQQSFAPLLLVGPKFDFWICVLLTSINPLRIEVCDEGMARQHNLKGMFCHLTNHSVNKMNENSATSPPSAGASTTSLS
jgi:hypothetical protein